MRYLKCVVWFVKNLRCVSAILRSVHGERNFAWFAANLHVIDRVASSLDGTGGQVHPTGAPHTPKGAR